MQKGKQLEKKKNDVSYNTFFKFLLTSYMKTLNKKQLLGSQKKVIVINSRETNKNNELSPLEK